MLFWRAMPPRTRPKTGMQSLPRPLICGLSNGTSRSGTISRIGWPLKAPSIGVERWSTPLLLLTLERTAPIEMTLIKGHARELLDAGPDAMVIADCDGSIVYVNDQTEKLFGYARDELIGRQVEMLLPERFWTTHPGLRISFAHNPQSRPMSESREVYAKHRDGSDLRRVLRRRRDTPDNCRDFGGSSAGLLL